MTQKGGESYSFLSIGTGTRPSVSSQLEVKVLMIGAF